LGQETGSTVDEPGAREAIDNFPECTLTRLHLVDSVLSEVIHDYLISRHLTPAQIHKYAYVPDDPRFHGRVALLSPVTKAWTARAFLPGIKPPYLNPSGSKKPWFTRESDRYVVVEGVFDAMAVERGGYAAAALLGSSLSGSNIDWFRDSFCMLLLDRRTSEKLWYLYETLSPIARVQARFFESIFPEYKDLGEVPTHHLGRLKALWTIPKRRTKT